MNDTCTWSQEDHESEVYHSSCRKSFMFNDGGPVQNGLKFCCYCGQRIDRLHSQIADLGKALSLGISRINELEAELAEQARLNGMGSEREARLLALNTELVGALRGWINQPEDAATYDACMARAEAALAKVEASNG